MRGRNYEVYDVFTDKVLTGNPLAIVHDAEGLDDLAMQRIAQGVQPVRNGFRPACEKHCTYGLGTHLYARL